MRTVLRGALLLCALSTALPASADVFINELHYDDADTPTPNDTNEAIEVVATGGEDLTQYSIVLYNGAAPAAATSYDTDPVPAGAVATCTGGGSARIAVLNYAVNGIQNGTADAIALVRGATVVQFLSYEGVATASNGPAAGLVSTDIGVSEISATVEGTSLQLGGGPGSTYAGFAWQPSATATMGACNNGQSFGAPVDNPPNLADSTPAQGDVGVPVSSTITLNFSEAVTTAPDPWFSLNCGAPVAATASGTGASRTITPDSAMPFGTSCTLTLTAANILDTDGTPDALAGTTSFSFTTAADNAPAVASTVPVDNAVGIAVNASIAINFSEPVNATDPWIALGCNLSGAHIGSISGGPSTFLFDPATNFTPGDACTVTLTAANIVDQDGAPQTLSGQNVFQFQVAPDVAPTLAGSYPVDGAVNVAAGSSLSVTFSEPVTVTPAAFVIACGATSHPYTRTSSDQTTYSLDPVSDFAENVACTLTISAAEVQDIDGSPTAMAADVVIDFITSAGISGYYERVDPSSCRALRATLHGVIDDHTSYPYTGAPVDVWTLIEAADQDPLNPNNILDIYRNRSMPKITARASGGGSDSDGFHYNREHTWPKSLGFPSATGDMGLPNAPHTDGHMLYASEVGYNSTRGNNPYVNCASQGSCAELVTSLHNGQGGGSGVFPGNSNWSTASGFEVWRERKGDAARAILYYDVRYEGGSNSKTGQSEPDLVVTDNLSLVVLTSASPAYMGKKSDLIAWDQSDPANAQDGLRNDVIESFQGNRNPFIDHHDWVAIAFAEPCLGPDVIAVDDDFSVPHDTLLSKGAPGVLRDDHNGANKNGQGLTATLLVPAQHGTATITNGSTGAFTYQPDSGFCGADQFTYQVSNGVATDAGVAHINVTADPCLPTLPDPVFRDGFE